MLHFHLLYSFYLDIIVSAEGSSGALKVKVCECEVNAFIDPRSNDPHTVHTWLVLAIHVNIRRTKHSSGGRQVATTALLRTWRKPWRERFITTIGCAFKKPPARGSRVHKSDKM